MLDITVGSNLSRPLLSLAVTNGVDARRVALVVDDLRSVGKESGRVYSCPAFSSTFPIDRFVFRAAAGGPVLAKITELAATPEDYRCFDTSLTIRGHREPPLQDVGVLLKQAGSLLNVRLIR